MKRYFTVLIGILTPALAIWFFPEHGHSKNAGVVLTRHAAGLAELMPNQCSRTNAGFYGPGKFGRAIGLPADGPSYPVLFSRQRVEEGTLSFWFKPPRQIAHTFTGSGYVQFGDGEQAFSAGPYSTWGSVSGRQFSVSFSGLRKLRVTLGRIPLSNEMANAFHHVLVTWSLTNATAYFDGRQFGTWQKETNKPWLAPFNGGGMTLSVNGFCSWLDEVLVLDRSVGPTEAESLYQATAPWTVDSHTAAYVDFEGGLIARSFLRKDGDALYFYSRLGVPEGLFRITDQPAITLTVVNTGPADRSVQVRGSVQNLRHKKVWERTIPVKARAGELVEVAVDLADLREKEKGLFWSTFAMEENGAVLKEEKITFAFTWAVDVVNADAGDIQTGLCISHGYNPPVYDKWDRVTYDAQWAALEQKPGEWCFDRLDMIVGNLCSSGRRGVLIMGVPPEWRRYKKRPDYCYINPDDVAGYKDYIRRVAERYRGKIFDYMFVGEAYFKCQVGAVTFDDYSTMVNAAAEILHAIDTNIQVACDMGGGMQFGEAISRKTAGKADYYTFHTYGFVQNQNPIRLQDEKMIAPYLAALKTNGASLRLANTELGCYMLMGYGVGSNGYPMTAEEFDKSNYWNTHDMTPRMKGEGRDNFCDWFTGAARVVRGVTLNMAIGCKYTMWWTWAGGYSGLTWPPYSRPSTMSAAYANISGLLAGYMFEKRLDLGSNKLKAYVFRDQRLAPRNAVSEVSLPTEALAKTAGQSERLRHQSAIRNPQSEIPDTWQIVAFTDDQPADIHLELTGPRIRVLDLYGNDYPFERIGPVVKVLLRPNTPLYIRGIAAAPEACPPVIRSAVEKGFAIPGTTPRVLVTFHNPLPGELKGKLRLKLPKGFPEPFAADICLAGKVSRDVTFEFKIPESVSGIQPMEFQFVSATPRFGDFSQNDDLPVKQSVHVKKLPGNVPLDGTLDAWGDPQAFPITIDQPDQVKVGHAYTKSYTGLVDWKGPKDLAAKALLAHDGTNMYVIIRAFDNKVINPAAGREPGRVWETGDSVELFLDARPPAEQGRAVYNHRVFHMAFAPATASFPAATFYVHNPRGAAPGGLPVRDTTGLRLESRLLPDGYFMEIKLPLANFFTVTNGLAVGFDLAVNDRDDETEGWRKTTLVWSGAEANDHDASGFGNIVFDE